MTTREKIGRKFANLQQECEAQLMPAIAEWFDKQRRQVYAGLSKFSKSEAGDIAAGLTDWPALMAEVERDIKPVMLNIVGQGGELALLQAGVGIRFDIVNERAVKVASEICGKMVREVTDETQKAIREYITKGIAAGDGMPTIAKQIRPLVGLTERQMTAVANHEEWLLVNRPELSRASVDRMVTTYEKRMHRRRAETIARTETGNAVSEGSLLGYQQSGVVGQVELNAAAEHCPICDIVDGKVYTLEAARGVLLIHPRCRCCWLPVVGDTVPQRYSEYEPIRQKLIDAGGSDGDEVLTLSNAVDDLRKKIDYAEANNLSTFEIFDEWQAKTKALAERQKVLSAKLRPLLYDSQGVDLVATPRYKVTEALTKNMESGLKEFGKFLNKNKLNDLSIHYEKIKSVRPYYKPLTKSIAIAQNKPDVSVIFHEAGHWLQYTNKNMRDAAEMFYGNRTKGEVAEWLGEGYSKTEMFKKDKFIDNYMGKFIDIPNAEYQSDEIISMGLQYMYENPYLLAVKDPEYFNFMLSILRGN